MIIALTLPLSYLTTPPTAQVLNIHRAFMHTLRATVTIIVAMVVVDLFGVRAAMRRFRCFVLAACPTVALHNLLRFQTASP